MSNRLADLEAGLARARDERKKTTSGPSAAASRSLALRRRRRRSKRKRVLAFGAVDYKVPGVVPAIKQPSRMACWATVYTMLDSWRRDRSSTIKTALEEVGSRWVQLFESDAGLSAKNKIDFVAESGLVAEPPVNPSVDGWDRWLRDYGPIWVTTDEKPGKPWAIHARVVTGIKGDGTPAGTKLTIIDPKNAKTIEESIDTFYPKYEEEVRKTGHTRIQILHWPKDARVSSAKGVPEPDWAEARSQREPDDRDWYTEEDDGAPAHAASIVFQSATAKSAAWATDAFSPDYQHLGVAGMSQAFALTADVLKRLAEANRFDLGGGQDEVLFGLRGCMMLDPSKNAFATSVDLSEDMPDHDDFHCVLGVWKRSNGKIALFPGSTVPNWHHMNKQKTKGGQRANMLLTGRYLYTVGKHRMVQGAFVQQPNVVVVRSNDDLIYEREDFFERHSPADNIHPAFSPTYGAKFSSAGCMTVPGSYKSSTKTHTGKWADFRKAAGLAASVTSKTGSKFVYMLLTGREARLAASGAGADQLTRLRFGSKGVDVEALQQGLQREGLYSGTVDGDMGQNTVWAWVRRQQKASSGSADGIVTPDAGKALGFDMIAGQSIPLPAAAQSVLPAALRQSFDIRHTVQLVPQQTKVSCWAAGAAMLISWLEDVSIDPSEIARTIDYWDQYKKHGLSADDTKMFQAWGLTAEVPKSYTIAAFKDLVETYGPLWVATWQPGEHIRVVTGISGDGSPDGTMVHINDPWEKGMTSYRPSNKGSIYSETYRRFMEKQDVLADREQGIAAPIYIAHLGEKGRKKILSGQQALVPDRTSAGLSGGTAVSAAALGYTVIKDITNNKADPTWTLQAMDGFYHPRVSYWSEADKKKYGLKPYTSGHFFVEGGMNTRAAGRNFAKFKVEFDHNGHFVANIQLKPVGHDDGNPINFWDLHVTQTIRRLSTDYKIGSNENVAAVKLDFTYRFSPGFWYDDKVFISEHTIYATGAVQKKEYWSQ